MVYKLIANRESCETSGQICRARRVRVVAILRGTGVELQPEMAILAQILKISFLLIGLRCRNGEGQEIQSQSQEQAGILFELVYPDDPRLDRDPLDRAHNDVLQTLARQETLHEGLHGSKWLRGDRRRRNLQSTTDDLRNGPTGYESKISVTGAGYSMRISIGTPPQSFTAFADTGSNLPWVQCSPCKNCFRQHEPIFQPRMSASYQIVPCNSSVCRDLQLRNKYAGCTPGTCQYTWAYGDKTHSRGEMAEENLTISRIHGEGKLTISNFVFGCGHDNAGSPNESGASGIIGLGRGSLSFPSQLGRHIGSKFSTCFVNRKVAPRRTSPLLFGEIAVPTSAETQYTPMLTSEGNKTLETYYYVKVEGVSVSGKRLGSEVGPKGYGETILDTGSTITSLVPHVYFRVMEEIFQQLPASYPRLDYRRYGLDMCFNVTGVANPRLPNLTLHLTNATWNMPHENMVIMIGEKIMCVALQQSKFDLNIIGNVQQQDFHILYDVGNSQIAFAKVKCDALEISRAAS